MSGGKTVARRCADLIDQEMGSVSDFVAEAGISFSKPAAAGSGVAQMAEWVETLPNGTDTERDLIVAYRAVVEESGGALLRLLGNASDHARALTTILRSPFAPMGSALTLSRGVLEAVLQVVTILDPHIRPRTAVLRALAYEVATVEGNEEASRAFRKMAREAQRTRAKESVDGLHEWLEKLGIERVQKGSGGRRTASLRFGGERSSIEFDVTAAMRRYLDGDEHSYALLSGAAHSRGWMLATTYLPDDEAKRTTPDQLHMVATLPLLDASEALVRGLGWYAGIDSEPLARKTHFRRRALLAAMGNEFSPMSLEDYRARTRGVMGRGFATDPTRWGIEYGSN